MLALALVGCGGATVTPAPTPEPTPVITAAPTPTPSPSPTPMPSPTPGATEAAAMQTGRVVVTDQGFAITLADGWTSIPLSAEDIAAAFDALDPNSELAKLMKSQAGQGAAKGMKLWAFDVRPESLSDGFAANLNVITAPSPGMSMVTIANISVAQIKPYLKEGAKLDVKETTIPAGKAATVTYTISVAGANGTHIDVKGKQLYIEIGSNVAVFTFSCSATKPGECPADTTEMINSLELL